MLLVPVSVENRKKKRGEQRCSFAFVSGISCGEVLHALRSSLNLPRSLHLSVHSFLPFFCSLTSLYISDLGPAMQRLQEILILSSSPTPLPLSPSCSVSLCISPPPVLPPGSASHGDGPAFTALCHLATSAPLPFRFISLRFSSFFEQPPLFQSFHHLSALSLLCIRLLLAPASVPPTTQIPPQNVHKTSHQN